MFKLLKISARAKDDKLIFLFKEVDLVYWSRKNDSFIFSISNYWRQTKWKDLVLEKSNARILHVLPYFDKCTEVGFSLSTRRTISSNLIILHKSPGLKRSILCRKNTILDKCSNIGKSSYNNSRIDCKQRPTFFKHSL